MREKTCDQSVQGNVHNVIRISWKSEVCDEKLKFHCYYLASDFLSIGLSFHVNNIFSVAIKCEMHYSSADFWA